MTVLAHVTCARSCISKQVPSDRSQSKAAASSMVIESDIVYDCFGRELYPYIISILLFVVSIVDSCFGSL